MGKGEGLLQALPILPEALEKATQLDWSSALDIFRPRQCAMVLGRGPSLALAQEAALKLKETCCMQAEAFSGAEVIHGPMALVEANYPLLIFALPGAALSVQRQLARDMRLRGARVFLVAESDVPEADLHLPSITHEALGPIVAAQAFYMFAEQLSREKGFNPDVPRHLSKITFTV
jgi:glutamine---fructose-6-phosphate transaminase (isomerizing)